MKNRVHSTYHFSRGDSPEDGPKPDESGVRREIEETINLLGIAHLPGLTPSDLRCVNAMTSGFTAAQFVVFRDIVVRAIADRRSRQERLRDDGHALKMADQVRMANAVLADLAGIEKRWWNTDADLVLLVAHAEEVYTTGLEPNSTERAAAAKAAT